MKRVTVKIALDAKSKEEKKSIFLAITHERQTRQYSLGIDMKLTKKEFSNPRLKVTKEALDQATPYYIKAEAIIKELGDNFSFIRFADRFKGTNTINNVSTSINDVFEQYVNDNRNLHQGTIDNYKSIINHINKFHSGLKITDLDVNMILKLQDYIRASYRKEKGKEISETTIGIYMRALRAIYNYAQKKFHIPVEHYPFGRNKIIITSSQSSHRAMSDDDFKKFVCYKPVNKGEEYARDMFLISFGLAGMNTADILNLKNKNIKDNGELEYIREKTKDRTVKRTTITMKIPPEIQSLINKYAAIMPESPEEYIFPSYNNKMSEKQKLRKRKDVNRAIDRSLKDICNNIGIAPVTTYWARHTIATKLINAGQSPATISRLLGHTSLKTTDIYLGQLGLKNKEDTANCVSSFLTELQTD